MEAVGVWSQEECRYRKGSVIHSLCKTRLRIGILEEDGETVAVRWCWRCREVLRVLTSGDDGPGESVPDEDDMKTGEVIPFQRRA
jgi:hypothetical protein